MGELADEEVDLIFTSPPYWNKRKYDVEGGLGNEKKSNEYVSNLVIYCSYRNCYKAEERINFLMTNLL